jgi:outer membrane protein assembly factor BamB
MRIQEFIDALERRDVVGGDLARKLRAKAIAGDHHITPEAVLKYLVKHGTISGQQAEELELSLLNVLGGGESEILNLMPLPDDPQSQDDELTAFSLEEEAAEIVRAAPPPKAPASPPPPPPSRRSPTDDDQFFAARETALPIDPRSLEGGARTSTAGGVYRLGGDKKKGKKRTAGGKNQWDSPLILLGGGALVLLVVAGAALYYLIFRETADAVLKDAENLLKGGAYAQAIERYQDFVARFGSHPEASRAKVQLEMTKLWKSVEGREDPGESLLVAKKSIGAIEDQPAFTSEADAKRDLSTLLVRIGRSLVEAAEKSTDPNDVSKRVEQIQNVLDLSANEKYVPENLRNEPELAAIRDSLTVIDTRQQRGGDLAETIAKMDAAVASGDTAAAYAARLTLLASYPALADDEALAAKVKEVSAAEQAAVKFVPGDAAAATTWPPRSVVAELAMAERRPEAGAAASGPPIVVRVDGALYGLRTGDGALLWRRFAGLGETAAPLMLEGGGVVAADLRDGQLWRLDGETGKLVWRQPLGEKIAGVVAAGQRLLATGESGKLFIIEAGDGKLVGHVKFGQPIRSAPAVTERGDRIYVVGESSIIYALSGKDYSCLGVYYLGHAAGAIVAPPVTVLNKLIVADNLGDETCRVRVLGVDDAGTITGDVAGDRLAGRVVTPLSTAARRLAAATTSGQLAVYEISGADDQSALTVVARREGQDKEPTARYALLEQGQLWVAGRQLMKLTVLPTENQLSVASLDHDHQGDAFDAPLAVVGEAIIHVRRPNKRAGAIVGATNAANNRTAWETELAVPLAGAPAVGDPLQLSAIAASGAAYVLDRQAMIRGVQDQAVRASLPAGKAPPLTDAVDLGGGRLAAGAVGGTSLVIFRPADSTQPVQTVELAGPLSCAPIGWHGGIVAPTDVGQVFLIDADSGESAATAFQPELEPDRKYHWLTPAQTGATNAMQLLLSDGAEKMHLIEVAAQPTPHLAAVKSVDVGAAPLASRLAVTSKVFAGTEDGRLASFALPELTAGDLVELGGHVVWGPFAAGEGVLLATDTSEVMLVGADGAVKWRHAGEHGALSGKPLVDGPSAIVLHGEGGVSRINLADGTEAGYAELGQPAVAGPVALGERLVVAAPDGALLVVNRP